MPSVQINSSYAAGRRCMQLSISLFATRDELEGWVAAQAKRLPLHFALVRHRPTFELVPLPAWGRFLDADRERPAAEVWMDLQPIDIDGRGHLACCDRNPHRLSLHLPERRPEGLREGSLGTISTDETRLRAWRSVVRFVRERTTGGMWAVNARTRARGFYKHLRYSPAVAALHRQGLDLLPLAGDSRVVIEPEVAGG